MKVLNSLGQHAKPRNEGGWHEDKSDRRVTVADNELELKGTFEHESNNGGSHRVTATFQVNENVFEHLESETSVPYTPDDEAALQKFVNEHYFFDGGC